MAATPQPARPSAEEVLARLDRFWQQAQKRMGQGLDTHHERAVITSTLKELEHGNDDLACQWMRGKRPMMQRLTWAWNGSRARSSAYEWGRAASVAVTLADAGLIDSTAGYRDRETGRRVKTLFREIGRIEWNLTRADHRAALIDTYRNLRDQPLAVIKAAIYDHNYGEK